MSKQNQAQNQQQAEPAQAKTAKQEIQGMETAVIPPFPSLQRAYTDPTQPFPSRCQNLTAHHRQPGASAARRPAQNDPWSRRR